MINKNILLIEDNAHASLIADELKYDGFNVVWVDNLLDAKDYLDDDPESEYYCAIILDLNMPDEGMFDEDNEFSSKMRDSTFDSLSGWLFYEKFIEPDEIKREKTIFYSAYSDSLNRAIGMHRFNILNFVSKTNRNLYKNIIEVINSLIEEN